MPLSACVTARTESPAPSRLKARLPRPCTLCMPKIWPRQLSRSTSRNCMLEVTAMPFSALAMPSVPLAVPPNACDSPTVRSSLPSCIVAATAVRPNCALAILMLAADSRRSRLKSSKPLSAIGRRSQLVFIAGQKPHAGNIGRQIERIRRKRALHQPMAVGRQRQRAFGAIAVELDIDIGQATPCRRRYRSVRASAKRPKPPNGTLLLPVQCRASRSEGDFDVERAVELQRRLIGRRAIEGDIERARW